MEYKEITRLREGNNKHQRIFHCRRLDAFLRVIINNIVVVVVVVVITRETLILLVVSFMAAKGQNGGTYDCTRRH